MKVCAVYARVSTDMQGESLENQVDYAAEYVRRLGADYRLDESCVYTDFDQSGYYTRFVQRPAIQRALEDAKKRRYDLIVFKEISRISRDQAEHVEIVSRFTNHGVRVIAINDNLDSERPETLDLLGIHSVMSEMESKRISSRVSSGKKSLARRGHWTGEPPIGYKLNPDTRKLEVDELTSEVPQTIFRLFVQEGYGSFKIAEYLNHMGRLTKNGRLWSRVTVARVLRNPAYVGDLVYGKTRNTLKRIFDDNGYTKVKGKHHVPKEDWVVVQNSHPPLVDRQTFRAALHILSQRAKQNPGRSRHPLTGILKCGRCGEGMICQKKQYRGTTYRYYTCARAFKFGRAFCNQPNLNAASLESRLWKFLLQSLHKQKPITLLISLVKKAQLNLPSRRKQLERDLSRAQIGMERLLMETDLPASTFQRLKSSYIDTIQSIEQELNRLARDESVQPDLTQWSIQVDDFLRDISDLDSNNLDELRRIFHGLVRRMTVNGKDIVELELKYKVI